MEVSSMTCDELLGRPKMVKLLHDGDSTTIRLYCRPSLLTKSRNRSKSENCPVTRS